MLHGRSRRAYARWAIGLLAPGIDEDVLEIGCASGYALGLIAPAARGRIVGIDRSAVLLRIAEGHLRRVGGAARTTLICAAEDDLPSFDVAFEKILAINAWPFCGEPARVFGILRERLAPGGRIAVAVRTPRRAAPATAEALGAEIARALETAGFGRIEAHGGDRVGGRRCVCVTACRTGVPDR